MKSFEGMRKLLKKCTVFFALNWLLTVEQSKLHSSHHCGKVSQVLGLLVFINLKTSQGYIYSQLLYCVVPHF